MAIAAWVDKGYVKQYLPVAYLLLSNKTQFIYDMALKWVKEELSKCRGDNYVEKGGDKTQKTIVTDFEKGLMNACKSNFPEYTLVGDLFHLKNKLWIRGGQLGLGTKENNNLLALLSKKLGNMLFKERAEF